MHFSHIPATWKVFDISARYITLAPREHRTPFSAKLSSNGSFELALEDIGDYQVQLQLGDPLYLRSVRLNGQEIAGRYFNLAPGTSNRLEVEVSGDAGHVKASVEPDSSLPRPEPPLRESCGRPALPEYQMVLFPDPLFSAEDNSTSGSEPRLITAYGGAEPTLQTGAVPPGRYRALAGQQIWKAVVPLQRSVLSDDDRKRWSELAALGQPLTLKPGETLEIVLPDRTLDIARLAAASEVPLESGLLW